MTTPVTPYDRAAASYRAQAAQTASPSALLIMLYDRAIGSIHQAEAALRERSGDHVAVVHAELTRAQDIVSELQFSLDHERGGMVAGQLDALYDFCLQRLIRANVDKDAAPLATVATILDQLRSAFQEASALAETA